VKILTNAIRVFRERCVVGIRAHPEAARRFAERTVSLGAVLSPRIGYDRAAKIVMEAATSGRTLVEVTAERLGISEVEARALLDPARWTRPGILGDEG